MMDRKKLKQEIKADANPEKLVAAIQRGDKSYIRGALQWYEKNRPKGLVTELLRTRYYDC